MYKAASTQTPPTEGTPTGEGAGTQEQCKKDEGVIDAEYVDVDK
jgi:hypothetical protein